MFTGIIVDVGEIVSVDPRADGLRRLEIACGFDRTSIAIGASIACSGVCLTVVETKSAGNRTIFVVDAAAETMQVTTAADWKAGTRLNLERALKIGDELGGHLVAGHVDGIAELVSREDLPDMAKLTLRAPRAIARFIAAKGSVCLDGVSLTVNTVDDDRFSVLIIPHTLKVTTLGALHTGARINIEADLIARYAARLAEKP
jgi:riboflavin synthase